MVVLKKLKASTLMETLVASVLIVIVFMVSSLILNNVFFNRIKGNTNKVDSRLNELYYLRINGELELPFTETYNQWNISLDQLVENNKSVLEIEAVNIETNKTIIKQYFETK